MESHEIHCSQLRKKYVGYAEKETEKLRNSILNTTNTDKYYEITGKTYYISAVGNDSNSGTTPSEPFKTPEIVNDMALMPGDAVLFERGYEYRLKYEIVAQEGVTYGSYGIGCKPKLYGSPKNYAENTVWKRFVEFENVWYTVCPYKKVYNIVFDFGKENGIYKDKRAVDWRQNRQFYHIDGEGILLLYCDKGNPADVYESIEISTDNYIIGIPTDVSDVTIDNLCMKYAAIGAVNACARNNNINVTNCEIGFIGGKFLQSLKVRMGNAVGSWAANNGFHVNHNWIYQTWDTAISPQGFYGGEYVDISFCDNLLEFNNADFEWFDKNNALFKNFHCDRNIMRFTCLGWGTQPDGIQIRGIEGCIRASTTNVRIDDFSFKDNIIDCPGRWIINWEFPEGQDENFDISGNVVYVKSEYRKAYAKHSSLPSGEFDNPAVMVRFPVKGNESFRLDNTKYNKIYAQNQAELEEAWKLFDKSDTSKVYWFD